MYDDVLVAMKNYYSFLVAVTRVVSVLLLLYPLGSSGATVTSGSKFSISQNKTILSHWKQWSILPNFRRHQQRKGSFLTVQTPTPERLSVWFGTSHRPKDDSNTDDSESDDWLLSFNHQHVGLTNPFVRIFDEGSTNSESMAKSKRSDSINDWWPDTAYSSTLSLSSKTKWRILRFCRCNVGQGHACYQRVRESVLAWQFASDGGKGILQVPITTNTDYATATTASASASSSSINEQEQQESYSNDYNDGFGVHSLLSRRQGQRGPFDDDGSKTPAVSITALKLSSGQKGYRTKPRQDDQLKPRRSLATYTSIRLIPKALSRFFGGDRKLYCLNPVHVIYDWVDQLYGGDNHTSSTMYTSTAYATGKGHWLCGEERVTVALRENGRVDVELLSFSKPANSFMGWLVWPVIGKMQTTFFLQELDALERVARQNRTI